MFLCSIHSRDVLQGTLAIMSRERFAPLHPHSGNVWWHHSAHPHSLLWSPCICGSGHHCTLWIIKRKYRNYCLKCFNHDFNSKRNKKKNKELSLRFWSGLTWKCIKLMEGRKPEDTEQHSGLCCRYFSLIFLLQWKKLHFLFVYSFYTKLMYQPPEPILLKYQHISCFTLHF